MFSYYGDQLTETPNFRLLIVAKAKTEGVHRPPGSDAAEVAGVLRHAAADVAATWRDGQAAAAKSRWEIAIASRQLG
jgi:hypothetical protein